MKKLLIFLLWGHSLWMSPSRIISMLDINTQKSCCNAAQYMYKISEPGIYEFSQSIIATPKNNNIPIILIDCNDVILDLNSQTLSMKDNLNFKGVTGIKIASGKVNITIQNGTIYNFTGNGIESFDSINIFIKNLTVHKCLQSGTALTYCKNININKCILSANNIGIYFDNCSTTEVTQCKAQQQTTTGYKFVSSSDIGVTNCSASKNGKNETISCGFELIDCYGINFTECSSLNNGNIENKVYGFYCTGSALKDSYSVCFYKCKINGNVNFTQSLNPGTFGIYLSATHACQIIDCEINSNICKNGLSIGIYLSTEINNNNNTIVSGNKVFSNSGIKQFGFYDENFSSTALLKSNTIFGHGPSMHNLFNDGLSCLFDPEISISGTNPRANYYFTYNKQSSTVQDTILETSLQSLNALESFWHIRNLSIY